MSKQTFTDVLLYYTYIASRVKGSHHFWAEKWPKKDFLRKNDF